MVKPPRSTPYHHGNLRSALVQTALELLESKGADAVTLRELAVAAGVSPAAPYRHFADRAAVLEAVAASGYDILSERYAAAMAAGGTPKARMHRAMQSFLDFSRERPHLFLLMYGAPLDGGRETEGTLRALEAQHYQNLVRDLAGCWPRLDEVALRRRTITWWAMLFGHAMSSLRHPLQPMMTAGLTPAEIDAAVIEAALSVR